MKLLLRLLAIIMASCVCTGIFAQTVKGVIKNRETGEVIAAVSVMLDGTTRGTFTNSKGEFELKVPAIPAKLVFSSIGYETVHLEVADASSQTISLVPGISLGQEVVVSASRQSERILESPVSVERVSSTSIKNAPAASYYDVVANLKGVDMVTSSLTFKTPTTRGFNGSGNLRFNQIVDGMDNQAPGLNFSVGSVIGITQLDVDNMELLPGASSVLYGPGGMNGTLVVNSKNPFKYQGLSLEVKQGVMHVDGRQRPASGFQNYALRWGYKVSEKVAFKIATEYLSAKDWVAQDYRNYARVGTSGTPQAGTRLTDPNYDGINVYGDETTADIRQVLNGIAQQAPFLASYISTLTTQPINVSRTGYNEKDIIDPKTLNFKLSGSFNWKITPATEMVLAGNWGTGNTVYTGSDRYSLKNMKMGQYKLEFNNKNWFVRAYTTQENAGESFNATVTTRLTNEAWKASGGSTGWFAQYGQAFLNAKLGGVSDYEAHNAARAIADIGRPDASSAAFKRIFDSVRAKPISEGGGLFVDKTDLYMVEGQYNLSQFTGNIVDLIIGGNFKNYSLNSEGTLFADSTGRIGINEYGGYIQASKDLWNRVKLTLAGRYDKNENFEGRFTPRATALIRVAENNNIRFSYQTAYRFPSTQQQWINLFVGANTWLIGGDQSFRNYYHFNTNPVFYLNDLQQGNLVPYDGVAYKPESVSSFELGYKGLTANNKLMIDAYGYFGRYRDFLTRVLLVQKNDGSTLTPTDISSGNATIYSVPANVSGVVKTYGFGLGLDYRFLKNFSISTNVSSDNLSDIPAEFETGFNSPKWRFNASLANTGFLNQNRAAFNITYRWQDTYFYNGDFANGQVPAINVLDAQFSYKFPQIRSVIKLGANNLLNQYYVNAIGNAQVGGLYYIAIGYNL
ncbi:MAG: TonB-dependent receptor [Niabella sp.]